MREATTWAVEPGAARDTQAPEPEPRGALAARPAPCARVRVQRGLGKLPAASLPPDSGPSALSSREVAMSKGQPRGTENICY